MRRAWIVGVAAAIAAGPAAAEIEAAGRMAVEGHTMQVVGAVVVTGLIVLIVSGAGAILAARLQVRRRERRFACNLPIRTDPPLGDRVRIVDLSRNGARLRIVPPPVPGTRLRLIWGDLSLNATVVWSGEVFAGVRLQRTLRQAVLRRMLEAGPARAASPGLGVGPEVPN